MAARRQKRTDESAAHRALTSAERGEIELLKKVWSQKADLYRVTQKMVAEKAGVSGASVSQVFNYSRPMSDSVARAVAALLKVQPVQIKPSMEKTPVSFVEDLPTVPLFKRFADVVAFEKSSVLPKKYRVEPCYSAMDQYHKVLATWERPMDSTVGQAEFRRALGFCMLQLNRDTWFARRYDYLVINVAIKPTDPSKITLWTWDGQEFEPGYQKRVGNKIILTRPLGDTPEERRLELDGAYCVGYVRGVQYMDDEE